MLFSIKKDDIKLYQFIASIYEEEENYEEGIKYLRQALTIKAGQRRPSFLFRCAV